MTAIKPKKSPTELTEVERRRKISVPEAAEYNNLSTATFRRRFPHLIRKITPRRDVVELGDALDPQPLSLK
jgi:hypothetical protein